MGNVIAYSGISTKIRAMQRELLREEDYKKLAQQGISRDKALFLSSFKPYAELFSAEGAEQMHRADVERRLILSVLRDFEKLYRFANTQQRVFMDLYFSHFEVRMIKACLQAVAGHAEMPQLALYSPYFAKHSKIDLKALSESGTISQFIDRLSGTPYHAILSRLYESGTAGLVDYETAIDMRYFNTVWKRKDKLLKPDARTVLERTLGSRIDILNLNWIYRVKKYYKMTPNELYSLLIPVRYRISLAEMKAMAEAPDLPTFAEAERKTRYGPLLAAGRKEGENLGDAADRLLERLYRASARNDPYSIAPINTYFYLKEKEIRRIVSIIERSHYEA